MEVGTEFVEGDGVRDLCGCLYFRPFGFDQGRLRWGTYVDIPCIVEIEGGGAEVAVSAVGEAELVIGGAGSVDKHAREQCAADVKCGLFVGGEGASGEEDGSDGGIGHGIGMEVSG